MPRLRDEWPLTVFTSLAPAAVGAGAVLSEKYSRFVLDPIIFPASLVICGTIAAAFLISSAHIGRKMRMPRAIFNLFKSWLSREIFLMSVSCGLYLLSAAMFFFKDKYKIEDQYIIYAFWLATGVGIIGVFSIQRVYIVRSVSLWTGTRALSMLFSSMFLLGFTEAVLILHVFTGEFVGDIIWRYIHLFSIPVVLDVIQLNELKRLGHLFTGVVYAVLRLVPYAIFLQLSGRVDIVRLFVAMGFAFAGDLFVRFSFFGEYSTTFAGEVGSARLARLAPSVSSSRKGAKS